MGFSSVYRVLQEVFPQIDSRILRAVAIEHSKDADVAVEVVVLEVIPSLYQRSHTGSPPNQNRVSHDPSEGLDGDETVQPETPIGPVDVSFLEQSNEASSSRNDGSKARAIKDAGSSAQPDCTAIVEPVTTGSLREYSFHHANGGSDSVIENVSYEDHDQECAKNGGEDVALLGKSSGLDQEEAPLQVDATGNMNMNYETLDQSLMPIDPTNSQLVGNLEIAVTEELDPSSFLKATSENDLVTEMVSIDDESTMTSVITRSDQICSTELLEQIIEDARNNKKILVSAMDLVVDLMREVEGKEKAAEQAKEEAARGCSDILVKVDELKQALRLAKETNDMHTGEVYAEKAILATEGKELQLRLLSLSEERDKSLGILLEMREALETRLAAALREIEAAEEEKQEKQRVAKELLAFQETQMEKVVEESKRLKLEAEENSKLQEFLMDRGRAIDMLQGEISVKCQDVKLLKEKFDKRIPLGRSLSSSRTSSILAFSSSSSRSFSTPPEENPETFGTQKTSTELGDSYGFLEKSSTLERARSSDDAMVETVSPNDRSSSGGEKQDDRKLLLDDGWELFENGEF